MATDFERLSRLMLDEFKRVHERFDTVDAQAETAQSRLSNIETELRDIRRRLDILDEAATNSSGFAKEIDHALQRVGAIEKHLGLQRSIAG